MMMMMMINEVSSMCEKNNSGFAEYNYLIGINNRLVFFLQYVSINKILFFIKRSRYKILVGLIETIFFFFCLFEFQIFNMLNNTSQML